MSDIPMKYHSYPNLSAILFSEDIPCLFISIINLMVACTSLGNTIIIAVWHTLITKEYSLTISIVFTYLTLVISLWEYVYTSLSPYLSDYIIKCLLNASAVSVLPWCILSHSTKFLRSSQLAFLPTILKFTLPIRCSICSPVFSE